MCALCECVVCGGNCFDDNHKCPEKLAAHIDAAMKTDREHKHIFDNRTFNQRIHDGFLIAQGAYQ